jgi:hypothetical protein
VLEIDAGACATPTGSPLGTVAIASSKSPPLGGPARAKSGSARPRTKEVEM